MGEMTVCKSNRKGEKRSIIFINKYVYYWWCQSKWRKGTLWLIQTLFFLGFDWSIWHTTHSVLCVYAYIYYNVLYYMLFTCIYENIYDSATSDLDRFLGNDFSNLYIHRNIIQLIKIHFFCYSPFWVWCECRFHPWPALASTNQNEI